MQLSENQLYHAKHPICQTSEKPKRAANIRKAASPEQTSDMSNIRKTKKCCKHAKTSFTRANIQFVNNSKTKKCCKHPKSSFTRANIRYVKHPKNQKVLQTSEKQLFEVNHPISQTSEKPKKAANMRKPALPGQTSDISNIRKTKMWCNYPKTSFTMPNIRYAKHPKNQRELQTSEKQLLQSKLPICQTSEKPKSAANMRKPALRGQTSNLSTIQKLKSAANIRKAALRGQTSDMSNIQKIKSAANIRKAAFPGQTSDKSNIRKNKKCCKHAKPALPGQTSDISNIRKTKKCCKKAKTSFTRENIRYVKYPKKQKVLQTSEKQLYHGKHPMCQTSEKPNVVQTCENQLYQGKHPICQTSEKPKSAAIIQKPALPWQTSEMPNIQKTKKCCKHPKSSFFRANFRNVKHPKNQKVLQTCENQLYQGKHPMYQTSEKPHCGATMRKAALPGQTSDMSNIRKTEKCCKHPKTSFTRANIRYDKQPKNQKVLQTCENQLYQGKHPICQTSEKPKIAANLRKPALSGQTSDMSNNRKTKKCCKHAKTSLTRANIRYVKHPKNEKVLQTSEKQLFEVNHPISQTSEKPKKAANMRKPALPGQTSDISNIRKTKMWCKHAKTSFTRANIQFVNNSKTKKCCKHPKSSFTRANIRYVKHPKNQKVLQLSENQLYHAKHPICQTSEKPKSAANIRKAASPEQTSDMSNIRKTKKCCKHAKTSFTRANIQFVNNSKTKKCCKHPKSSFTRANIRYVKHSKNKKCCKHPKSKLFQVKHPISQTSEKPKKAANMQKPALPGQTSDISNIRKTKMWCKHAKTSFTRANIRYAKHPKNQKVLQTSEKQLFQGKLPICQTSEKPKSAAKMRKPALRGQTSDLSNIQKLKSAANIRKAAFPGQISDMSNIRKTKK